MPLFGPLHLTLLAGVTCVACALALLCRWRAIPSRATRVTLGILLAANEAIWWAFRYSHEGIHAANLPLQLCDATLLCSIFGCFTLVPAIVEFVYFTGIAGASMALLTPDLYTPWPTYPAIYFFIAHGGIVTAVALFAFGGMIQFRSGAVWRAFGWLLTYAAFVGVVNVLVGSNYLYLSTKPANPSLLDNMGPWPWYLGSGAALALALFGVLWLPVRPKAIR